METNEPRNYLERAIWNAGPRTTADAVIAHLWNQIERPDVIDLIDDVVSIHGMSRTEAEGIVADVLTALLGPNPNEQEAE